MFAGEVLQPSDHLGEPSHLSCAEESRAGCNYSRWSLRRAEQKGRITSPDLLATPLLVQPRIQLAAWTASTHCMIMSNFLSMRTSKFFSSRLLDTMFLSQSVFMSGIFLSLVLHLDLVLFQLFEVPVDLLFKFVQVPLSGIPSFRCVSCTVQLHVSCQPAECALNFTVHVIDEDIEEHLSQDRAFSPFSS